MKRKSVRLASLLLAFAAFTSVFSGCGEDTSEVNVYVPDGAPAMAIAKMLADDKKDDGVTYNVVAPTVIASKVTNKDATKNADICALPATAASKLLGSGDEYQMLGVLTSGNLYLLSNDPHVIFAFSKDVTEALQYLVGLTMGVMKINDVPGLTLKWALQGNNVPFNELKNDGKTSSEHVNLKPIVDATAIDPMDTKTVCYLVAEPAASVQVKNNGFSYACSLDALYNKAAGTESGYPQAVLVAKRSLIKNREKFVKKFMASVAESATYVTGGEATGEWITKAVTSHLEDSGYATTLKAPLLTQETISRCGVKYTPSKTAKESVKEYLQRISSMDASAAKTVEDKFFYLG